MKKDSIFIKQVHISFHHGKAMVSLLVIFFFQRKDRMNVLSKTCADLRRI